MENQVQDIERIVKDGIGKVVEVNGKQFLFGDCREVKPFKPSLNTINVSELSGLVDLIKNEYIGLQKPKLFVEVVSPTTVKTFTHVDAECDREVPYIAESGNKTYTFGRWQNYEDFIIALRSMFVDTPERNALIELIASVRNVDDNEISDNGISQMASTRKGALVKTGEIKAIYSLTPYRTFMEVDQARAEYLFRIRQNGQELSFALFAADGNMWELTQKAIIRTHLQLRLAEEIKDGKVVVIS